MAASVLQADLKCMQPDFPVKRIDDQTWRVETMNTHSLTIRYKVFGNDLSGTFSQLDTRHAHGEWFFRFHVRR